MRFISRRFGSGMQRKRETSGPLVPSSLRRLAAGSGKSNGMRFLAMQTNFKSWHHARQAGMGPMLAAKTPTNNSHVPRVGKWSEHESRRDATTCQLHDRLQLRRRRLVRFCRACPFPGKPGDETLSADFCYFKFSNRNDHMSAYCSIDLLTGVPAPWPALVSIRIRIGLSQD
ncbi:hypothetical protein FF011L_52040 [Roseimaritima multifibrata]|uniref:Uncharacterized protein n=1 Tax=Roseimaritima multifibrata TaxID=1930274 RepID=A0A517MNE8_9BACT|nr:hypothetical protein FF011L_52040 [Roseimaritima multifibrata]